METQQKTFDDLLSTIENRERSARRKAFLWTLLPIAAAVALLSYSSWQINSLEEKKTLIEKDLSDKQSQLAAKQEDINTLNKQLIKKQERLEKVSKELEQKQETLDYVGHQLATKNISQAELALTPPDAGVVETKPRIYIHIREKTQLQKAREIAEKLKASGYLVPRAEILVDKGPRDTQVRYFRQREREEASRIVSILKELHMMSVKVRYIRGYENSKLVKPRQFEIWLQKNLS